MLKKLILFFSIINLIMILSCNKKFYAEKEKHAVQEHAAAFYKALENGDFETTKKYLTDDWELFIEQDRISKENWLQFFDGGFKPAGNVKITINNSAWGVSPTMSWYKADENWEMGLHSQLSKRHFLTTIIWEKRNDQWQMVHAHHSLIP